MNLTNRMLRSLFVPTAVLLTCASLWGEWLFGWCACTDPTGNRISLFEALRKGEQLERECRAASEFAHTKDEVVEDLLTGDTTLIEAASCFRSLYEDARNWHHPHRPRPALDDGESWCREVIEWTVTKVHFQCSPSQADAVRQQLEAQLQNHLQYHGRVTLVD